MKTPEIQLLKINSAHITFVPVAVELQQKNIVVNEVRFNFDFVY